MTGHFFLAPLLLGASCLYLYVVVWSYRASRQRVFSLPWLLLPLGGALLAGITLALSVPTSPASSVSLRLLELLAHLCNILLIWTIAGKITPSYRLAGTWLYAWNPLVIIELAVYANTAGVVTCLLLLAIALLLSGTRSLPSTRMLLAFRRGGGGVDDGRGRLRRPRPLAEIIPLPVDEMIRGHLEGAGDASVPSPPDPAPAPTENEHVVLAAEEFIAAGDASVPSPPDPAPTEDESEEPDGKEGRRPQGSPPNLSSTPASTMNEGGEARRSHSRGGVEVGWGPLRSPSDLQEPGSKAPTIPRLSEIATLALVGLALRINFMTLLLAPLLLWFMVRHRRGVSAALAGFVWRALVVLAVFVLAYLPDWRGSETFLAITNGLSLFDFANSPLSLVVAPARALFTFVAQQAHFPPLMQPDIAADMTVLATSFFLFALLYLREMGRVREVLRPDAEAEPVLSGDVRIDEDRHKAPTPPLPGPLSLQDVGGDGGVGSLPYDTLFTSWAVVLLGYIVLAATVFMPGYLVWGVWVVVLRRFDTLTVAIVLLSCSALVYYLLQWLALPATSLLLPLCVFGIPLVYLVVQYCVPVGGGIERKHVLK